MVVRVVQKLATNILAVNPCVRVRVFPPALETALTLFVSVAVSASAAAFVFLAGCQGRRRRSVRRPSDRHDAREGGREKHFKARR